MNSRSKQYFAKRKSNDGDKKGSSTKAGYNEQNEKTSRDSKKNPAPPKNQDHPNEDAPAEQDDTSGPNNSGDRLDDN
jgi:hypothetical protein